MSTLQRKMSLGLGQLTPRGTKKVRATFVFKARVLEVGGLPQDGSVVAITLHTPKSKTSMSASESDTWVNEPGAATNGKGGPWKLVLNPSMQAAATQVRVVMTQVREPTPSQKYTQTPIKFRVTVDGVKLGSMYTDLAQLCMVPDVIITQEFHLEPGYQMVKLQLLASLDTEPMPRIPSLPIGEKGLAKEGSLPGTPRRFGNPLSARRRKDKNKVDLVIQVKAFQRCSDANPVIVEVYFPHKTLLGSTDEAVPGTDGRCEWDEQNGFITIPVKLKDSKNKFLALSVVNPTLTVGDIGEITLDVNELEQSSSPVEKEYKVGKNAQKLFVSFAFPNAAQKPPADTDADASQDPNKAESNGNVATESASLATTNGTKDAVAPRKPIVPAVNMSALMPPPGPQQAQPRTHLTQIDAHPDLMTDRETVF